MGFEYVEVELRLPDETAAFIGSVAKQAAVTPNQAASVIAVLALQRYLANDARALAALGGNDG